MSRGYIPNELSNLNGVNSRISIPSKRTHQIIPISPKWSSIAIATYTFIFSRLPGSILTSSSGNFSSVHSFEIISILAFGFLIFSSLFCYQKWRHRKYDVITINYIISLDFLSFRKLGLTCEKTSRESKYRRINWHCVWLANQKTLFTPTLIHPPDWESRKISSVKSR